MASRIVYDLKAEEAKRKLAGKILEGVTPVVAVPFPEGVAVVTPGANFRKIRRIHDTILFAALGDHQAINEGSAALINAASRIEMTLSSRMVAIDILADDPAGIFGQIARAFQSLGTRPMAIEFALISLKKGGGAEWVIANACGERRYASRPFETFEMTGKPEGSKSSAEPHRTADDPIPATEEAAIRVATERLKKGEPFQTVEIGVLRRVGDAVEFNHRWEENHGG